MEADSLVTQDRQAIYGSPGLNFQRTANLWEAYFLSKGFNVEVNPGDVAILMMLLKVARLIQTPGHRDSVMDVAGYLKTYAQVEGVE